MQAPDNANIKQIQINGGADSGYVKRRTTRSKRKADDIVPPVIAVAPAPAPAAAPLAEPTHKKFVLAPKKKVTRIVLTRRHAGAPAAAATATVRKPARKVTLGLASHTRRIRRGRKLQSDSNAMPLEELRKKLVEKGVIKETSKAPEAILRQLYIDTVSITEPVL